MRGPTETALDALFAQGAAFGKRGLKMQIFVPEGDQFVSLDRPIEAP